MNKLFRLSSLENVYLRSNIKPIPSTKSYVRRRIVGKRFSYARYDSVSVETV